jgi:hypothetical protein
MTRKPDHGRLYDALAERVWAAIEESDIFRETVFKLIAEYLKQHAEIENDEEPSSPRINSPSNNRSASKTLPRTRAR